MSVTSFLLLMLQEFRQSRLKIGTQIKDLLLPELATQLNKWDPNYFHRMLADLLKQKCDYPKEAEDAIRAQLASAFLEHIKGLADMLLKEDIEAAMATLEVPAEDKDVNTDYLEQLVSAFNELKGKHPNDVGHDELPTLITSILHVH